MPITGKTNKQTQHKYHPTWSLHTLGGKKPKGRIQPWSLGEGDLKHSKLKKKKENEKVEKYYKHEGTNQKHRSPNKRRGTRQTTWKRIQNNDSKNDKKTLKAKWRKYKNQFTKA